MKLTEVLREARKRPIQKEEALYLLERADNWISVLDLMQTARYVRDREVGRLFKLEVAITSTSECNTNPPCRYCGQSSEKNKFFREILTPEEVATAAKLLEQIGIRAVEVGGGCSGSGGKEAVDAVRAVKSVSNLSVWVNVGADLSEENMRELKMLGVDSIACTLEVFDETVFKKIKPGDDMNERKRIAKLIDNMEIGLRSGIMIGVGESPETTIEHIFWLKDFRNLVGTGVSGFYPIPGTPMENHLPATSLSIAKTIAIMRLIHRDKDIGGSFARDEQLQLWILAGSNKRIVHGVVRPRIEGEHFARRFPGDVMPISENFALFNMIPTYSGMIKEAGLESDVQGG